MAPAADHLTTTKRYLQAIESGATGDALAAFFAADVVQEEFPNRLRPKGGRADLAAMLAAALRGRSLMASQRYEVLNAVCSGDQVALEIQWSGTLAVAAVGLPAGGQMSARCAVFLEFRDGKIVRQRNYDCFDPW
jgi:ketosteroid isomerase-like protein